MILNIPKYRPFWYVVAVTPTRLVYDLSNTIKGVFVIMANNEPVETIIANVQQSIVNMCELLKSALNKFDTNAH